MELKRRLEATPRRRTWRKDVQAQVEAVVAWTWLQQEVQKLQNQQWEPQPQRKYGEMIQRGSQHVQEWLTNAMKVKQPVLEVKTTSQAAEIQRFRLRVSELDETSSKEVEQKVANGVRRVAERYRRAVDSGKEKPCPMALEEHQGEAGIFLSKGTVQKMLKKRKPRKAAALIPNAALNAAGSSEPGTNMFTWFMETIMVMADTGTILPQIQVHHKYKGNGKDPK